MSAHHQIININGETLVIDKTNDSLILYTNIETTELIKTNKIFTDIKEPAYFGKIGKKFYWFVKHDENFKSICITDESVFL